ncbi:MAG: hypothetical protein RPR28_06375 [Cycloclasticus sp.]|jgi:hypothetical protein
MALIKRNVAYTNENLARLKSMTGVAGHFAIDVNTSLSRYFYLMDEERPVLTKNEWRLIYNALSAHILTNSPFDDILTVKGRINYYIENEHDQPAYKIDKGKFISKIKKLTPAQTFSIIDESARYNAHHQP